MRVYTIKPLHHIGVVAWLFCVQAAFAQGSPVIQPITDFDSRSEAGMTARSVGKISIERRRCLKSDRAVCDLVEDFTCTGTIIASDAANYGREVRVLTNGHCFVFSAPSNPLKAWYVAAKDINFTLLKDAFLSDRDREAISPYLLSDEHTIRLQLAAQPIEAVYCEDPLDTNARCLDYAILKPIVGNINIPYLKPIDALFRDAREGEALMLIHFPKGGEMMVSHSGSCNAHFEAKKLVLYHRCETSSGSSGSVLFAESDGALVALHNLGWANYSNANKYASSVPISEIYEESIEVKKFTQIKDVGEFKEAVRAYSRDSDRYHTLSGKMLDRLCLFAQTMERTEILDDLFADYYEDGYANPNFDVDSFSQNLKYSQDQMAELGYKFDSIKVVTEYDQFVIGSSYPRQIDQDASAKARDAADAATKLAIEKVKEKVGTETVFHIEIKPSTFSNLPFSGRFRTTVSFKAEYKGSFFTSPLGKTCRQAAKLS